MNHIDWRSEVENEMGKINPRIEEQMLSLWSGVRFIFLGKRIEVVS